MQIYSNITVIHIYIYTCTIYNTYCIVHILYIICIICILYNIYIIYNICSNIFIYILITNICQFISFPMFLGINNIIIYLIYSNPKKTREAFISLIRLFLLKISLSFIQLLRSNEEFFLTLNSFNYNQWQKILPKVRKSGKIGQDKTTLMSTFAWLLSAIAKKLYLEGKLETSLCLHKILSFSFHFLIYYGPKS